MPPKPAEKKKCKRREEDVAAIKNEEEASNGSADLGETTGSALGTEMIDIKVGPAKTIFRVHNNIMCAKAPNFYTRAVEEADLLLDDELAIFGLFVNWLYTGELSSIVTEKGKASRLSEMEQLRLYGFRLKFDLAAFVDFTMTKCMAAHRERYASLKTIEFAYTNFPQGPFHRLMVHFLAQNLTVNHPSDRRNLQYDGHFEKLSQHEVQYAANVSRLLGQLESLRTDLVIFMMDHAKGSYEDVRNMKKNPLDLDPCLFHLHAEGPKHCKAKRK